MKLCMFLMVLFWALFVLAPPAHAYLDPGSGSMALQALLGGLAALMVIVKLYWSRLIKFFGSKKNSEPEATDSSSTNLN